MLSQTGEHGVKATNSTATKTTTITTTTTSSSTSSSSSSSSSHPSIIQMYRQIIRKEGFIGLWAGNGANLLRIFPAKAIVFSTNDVYKNFLMRTFHNTNNNTNNSNNNNPVGLSLGTISFLSGGFAGMTATAVTYPLDFARGRISGKLAGTTPPPSSSTTTTTTATTTIPQQHRRPVKAYSGIMVTLALTIKDEGFMALYKGMTPTILGAMPYEGIKFGTVGLLETVFPPQMGDDDDDGHHHHHQSSSSYYHATRKMIMGGIGGVMAGLITYPNDTIRRLLQLQGSRGTTSQYSGYVDCAIKTYNEHGIARFYRGLLINTIRMFPNVCIQFGSYELLKRWTAGLF